MSVAAGSPAAIRKATPRAAERPVSRMTTTTYRRRPWANPARLLPHPTASSICAATRNNTSSRPYAATACTPTGNPSAVQCTGNDTAGWPLMLNGSVNVPYGAERMNARSGSSSVDEM